MHRIPVLLSTCCSLVWLCGCPTEPIDTTSTDAPTDATPSNPPPDASPSSSFIRTSGKELIVATDASAETIQLRGINIQSFWLLSPDDLSNPFFNDDNADPYVYKPEGWALLDQQIALAKEAGLYTIIDMHVPPGGTQGFIGPSARLWEQPELRERTKALWRAIAERYRDEPWVAGYDLINEPMPTRNPGQWATFAQELVDSIRQVDVNHLIIVEEVLAVVDAQGTYPEIDPDDPWLPKVADDNAKGGLEYTADFMNVMNEAGLSHQFYAYLNVFFLDWEYAETPQLCQVTDSLKATLTNGISHE